MDKKDLFGYFYMILKDRNITDNQQILSLFEYTKISKLDINRFIRYIEQLYDVDLVYL